jgi:hypothetical protein
MREDEQIVRSDENEEESLPREGEEDGLIRERGRL